MMLVACGQSFSHGQSASNRSWRCRRFRFKLSDQLPAIAIRQADVANKMSNFDEESALMAEAISRVPQTSCP